MITRSINLDRSLIDRRTIKGQSRAGPPDQTARIQLRYAADCYRHSPCEGLGPNQITSHAAGYTARKYACTAMVDNLA
ncbi:hypothetical protein D3C75_1054920 [compost metagenome]